MNRYIGKIPGLLLIFSLGLSFALSGCINKENKVNDASRSVYRIIGAIQLGSMDDLSLVTLALGKLLSNVSSGMAADTLRHAMESLRQKGRAEGLEPFFLFAHDNKVYIEGGHGTCYRISAKNHFITNHHVVDGRDYSYFIVSALSPKVEVTPVTVVWKDKSKDLAVLEASGAPQGKALVIADSKYITQSLPVFSIGFPGAIDDLTYQAGFDSEDSWVKPSIFSGTLASFHINPHGAKVWAHSATISKGNSGGPLVNSGGQVVGTNVEAHKQNSQYVQSIAIDELLPELKRLNIPFVQASGPYSSFLQDNLPLVCLVGITLLLLLAVCGYLYYLRIKIFKGKLLKTDSKILRAVLYKIIGSQVDDKGEYIWRKDMNDRLYRWDPILGLVYKDDAPDTLEITIVPLFIGANTVTLSPGDKVSIGREVSSSIVLADKDISRKHCVLGYDGKSIVLIDNNSTNGTYLAGSSSRLNSARKLEVGQQFYLSDKKWMFTVQSNHKLDVPGKSAIVKIMPLFSGANEVTLTTGGRAGIGRDASNSIVLADKDISRKHCLLSYDGERIVLTDKNSTNGTFLLEDGGNGGRIKTVALYDGGKFFLSDPKWAFEVHIIK